MTEGVLAGGVALSISVFSSACAVSSAPVVATRVADRPISRSTAASSAIAPPGVGIALPGEALESVRNLLTTNAPSKEPRTTRTTAGRANDLIRENTEPPVWCASAAGSPAVVQRAAHYPRSRRGVTLVRARAFAPRCEDSVADSIDPSQVDWRQNVGMPQVSTLPSRLRAVVRAGLFVFSSAVGGGLGANRLGTGGSRSPPHLRLDRGRRRRWLSRWRSLGEAHAVAEAFLRRSPRHETPRLPGSGFRRLASPCVPSVRWSLQSHRR